MHSDCRSGGELHLAELVLAARLIGLAMVQGVVESGEQPFGRPTLALFEALDELRCPSLGELEGAAHAEKQHRQPNEAQEETNQGQQENLRGRPLDTAGTLVTVSQPATISNAPRSARRAVKP